MLRLASDADVNEGVVTGLRQRSAMKIDIVQSRTVFGNALDPDVLAWAARENRVLISNDKTDIAAIRIQSCCAG